jgi:hypothetical protein
VPVGAIVANVASRLLGYRPLRLGPSYQASERAGRLRPTLTLAPLPARAGTQAPSNTTSDNVP